MTGTRDRSLSVRWLSGRMVRLGSGDPAPGGGPPPGAPNVGFTSVTFGSVTNTTLTIDGDPKLLDTSRALWSMTPPADGYSASQFRGPNATFRHQTGTDETTVTVKVPVVAGGTVTATAQVVRSTRSKSGMFPKSFIRGAGTAAVEESFGFEKARTYTARLWRTTSPGKPAERTLIEERRVDFPLSKEGTPVSRDVSFPASSAPLGEGWQFLWEVETAPGHVIHSQPLPMWVIGSDPKCAPAKLSDVPLTLDYPAIYTRRATDSGKVAPTDGSTYTEHQAKLVQDIHATGLKGPWLSYKDYYANIHWVDLDDPNVPRHRITHWDVWGWARTLTGWYGRDTAAKPWPREYVAVDVPIPHGAASSLGTDRSLAIVGTRGGKIERIWEMWLAQRMGDGTWRAASIGVTKWDEQWRHSQSYTVAAAGLSALGYAFRVAEADACVRYIRAERAAGRQPQDSVILGIVRHALSLNLPNPRLGLTSWPATYSDGGNTDRATAREGQLVRLAENADIEAAKLPPFHHAIAVVGKHRGFFITDKTSYSTTLIVEGDLAYGGGLWDTIREPGESWEFIVPNNWWVPCKQYPDQAAWDADTTTPLDTTNPPAPAPPAAKLMSDSLKSATAVDVNGRALDYAEGGTITGGTWTANPSLADGTRIVQATPTGVRVTNYGYMRHVNPNLPADFTVSVRLWLDKDKDVGPVSAGRVKIGYTGSNAEVVGVVVKHAITGKLQVDRDGAYDTTNGTGTLLGTPAYTPGDVLTLTREGRKMTVSIGAWSASFTATSAVDTATPGFGFSTYGNAVFRASDVTITTAVPTGPTAPTTPTTPTQPPTIAASMWADSSPESPTATTWVVPVPPAANVEIIERAV